MPLVIRVSLAIVCGMLLTLLAQQHAPTETLEDGPSLSDIQVERTQRDLPRAGIAPAVRLTRRLTLHGTGFRRRSGRAPGSKGIVDVRNVGQPQVSYQFADGRDVCSPLVRFQDEETVVAWVPEGVRGTARIVLRNPDGHQTSLVVDL